MAELKGQKSVGLYNYATHPSTKASMLGWAVDDGGLNLWELHLGSIPNTLYRLLRDPMVDIVAFNSQFERYIFKYVLGIAIPIRRFQDPQVSCRYLSLPGDLDEVSQILKLGEAAKDARGERLIQMFSKPSKRSKKDGGGLYFKNWETHPEEWKQFGEYCKQDVAAERALLKKLMLYEVYPLPPRERRLWIIDQKINDRGMPADRRFIENALALATQEKNESIKKMNELTGLENSNSNSQLQKWVNAHGYKPKSLGKARVAFELETNAELEPVAREVLTLRKTAASTSFKKFSAMLRHICPDNRIRNMFVFMGSSRCGRWSGAAVQPQNMARPDKDFEDLQTVDEARDLIYNMEYDKLKTKFGSVLRAVKSTIRTAFVAPNGSTFCVSDKNAIETRVGAWMSGCEPLLDVFKKNRDPYVDFAARMEGIPYEVLWADYKSDNQTRKAEAKFKRQVAKPGMLGCIYRLGGGGWGMKKGEPIKIGLFGYADGMGVKMTQERAHEIVQFFRSSYHEIVSMWYLFEKVIAEVLLAKTDRVEPRRIGPDGCIVIDRLDVKDPAFENPVVVLRIMLPSGRRLHYLNAYIDDCKMPWKDSETGEDVYKKTLFYDGQDQETHQWTVVTAHGGKTFENVDQGISRDALAEDVLNCDAEGIVIDGHAHDELITEAPQDQDTLEKLVETMSQSVKWAPSLPMKAEGFAAQYYHK